MKNLKTYFSIFILIILFIPTLSAQDQQKQKPCSAPEFRAFDFWIGSWEVFTPDGKLAGTNDVKLILGSCVINENWEGVGGSVGQSFNTYNPRTGTWTQTWVDNGGNNLVFEGHAGENEMLLRGESTGKDGKPVFYKLSFFYNPDDDTVHQVWEASRDEVKYQTIFDGLYRKKKDKNPSGSGK